MLSFYRYSIGFILLPMLLSLSGCKDPIPPVADEQFSEICGRVKYKMEEFLPERNLILTSFRARCELQKESEEFPVRGTILVNYRGEKSPIDKSNQLTVNYAFREKNQIWIYKGLKIDREILGEDLQDQDAMFEAVLRVQPTKKSDQEPLL